MYLNKKMKCVANISIFIVFSYITSNYFYFFVKYDHTGDKLTIFVLKTIFFLSLLFDTTLYYRFFL